MDSLLPPSSIESEEAILASIFFDPSALPLLARVLKPEHFYVVKNGWIYQAMLSLYNRQEPTDRITVPEELERQGVGRLSECGGYGYLSELDGDVPNSMYVESYAKRVIANYMRRMLIAACSKAARVIYDQTVPIEDVCNLSVEIVSQAARNDTRTNTRHIGDVVNDYMSRVQEAHDDPAKVVGVPTHFIEIDKMLGGGLRGGQLVIVAARPGMGKTSLLNSLIRRISANDKKECRKTGVYFTLEMSDEEQAARLISMRSRVSVQDMNRGRIADDKWLEFVDSCVWLSEASLYVNDAPMSINQIRAECETLRTRHKIDYVLIDFLGLVDSPGTSDYERASLVALGAKNIAKALRVPVILACQLSRKTEVRQNKRPELSDLRDSGKIEEAADIVLGLYRDEYYNPETDFKNVAEVQFLKNRSGTTGKVDLYFDAAMTEFKDLAKERLVI